MYRDFRDHNSVFEGVAARFPTALNLTHNNRSERIQAELVSGTWFDTLGLTTALGRGITVSDDLIPGAHPVVVLTYDYWKSRFNGNPGILNQTLLLNGHPMTVVGVTAPGYHGFDPGARVDVLVPTMMKAEMTPTWNGLQRPARALAATRGPPPPGSRPAPGAGQPGALLPRSAHHGDADHEVPHGAQPRRVRHQAADFRTGRQRVYPTCANSSQIRC